MFSFAGVVKILEDNNLSLWTFDSLTDEKTSATPSESCVDAESNDCAADRSDGQPAGRDRWLKGRAGSIDSDENTSDESPRRVSTPEPFRSELRVIKEDSVLAIDKPPVITSAVDTVAGDSALGRSCSPLQAQDSSTTTSKKKKKKKNRSRANSTSSAASASSVIAKKVSFGDVEEVCFSRGLAFDRVPSDGSYPLGLGAEVSRCSYTVDENVNMLQGELIQRAIELGMSLEHMADEGDEAKEFKPLETRQFDYKSGKNFLFRRLSEEDRIVLVGSVKVEADDDEEIYKISDYNKEVKSIRSSRMETGCSCKPIKVDKLSVVKMKGELANLNCESAEINKMSKGDMSALLKEKLSDCQLCADNNCYCYQMGIPCSADSCGCLKNGAVRQACGNTHGQRVYDSDYVNMHRIQYLPANSSLRKNLSRRGSLLRALLDVILTQPSK